MIAQLSAATERITALEAQIERRRQDREDDKRIISELKEDVAGLHDALGSAVSGSYRVFTESGEESIIEFARRLNAELRAALAAPAKEKR